MEIAERTGKTLQEAKRGTTSSEFVLWMVRLENELIELKREDKYVGKILAEIRRSWVTDPSKVDEDVFVPKWQWAKEGQTMKEDNYDWKASKAGWLVAAGLDPKNPKAGRKEQKTKKPPTKARKARPIQQPQRTKVNSPKVFLTKEARAKQAQERGKNV